MKTIATLILIFFASQKILASTNYVGQAGTPSGKYFTDIQSAVDAASAGDLVFVSNGIYNTGERVTPGYALSNRVIILEDITLRSVSGPETTIILGNNAANGGCGTGAVRCVFMTAGTLSGFTISNGHTLTSGDFFNEQSGGGIWSTNGCVVTNCIISGNASDYDGGGVFCLYGGLVSNCKINGNEAEIGGGIFCYYGGEINNCTFTGNSAKYSGGMQCSYGGEVNNCTFSGNSADIAGGISCYKGGEVNNCTVIGNSAEYGGGVQLNYSGLINKSMISGNNAEDGGGIRCYKGGVISNCNISSNEAEYGGGIQFRYSGAIMDNCIIIDNTAEYGGGIRCKSGGMVNNSTFTGNYAEDGGGIYCGTSGTFNNCSINLNFAFHGGGVYCNKGGILKSCTISGNDSFVGGGVICDEGGSLTNTIIFSNTALVNNNWANYNIGMSYAYCCTTPDPGGAGNITNDPALVNFAHIATNSPCTGMGDNSSVTGVDIDGDAWLNPPAIGCDQPTLSGLTGVLSVVVYAEMTNLTVGAQCRLSGNINGIPDMILWSFGDGKTSSDLSYSTSYAWNTPGEYPVILTVLNSDNPSGVAGTVTVYVVSESTHYVDAGNASPLWPYISWSTAATNIQDAIDACFLGGKVLVTNGVYATGMRAGFGITMLNRVVITKNIPVESVNGADDTIILGSPDPITGGNGTNAVRCVYISAGSINGFTFSNGYTRTYGEYDYERCGGGVLCNFNGTISNCVISGNNAFEQAGGVYCLYGGMVNDCEIIGNNSYHAGGISCYYDGLIINSTINNNGAIGNGGGLMFEYGGMVNNSTIKNNIGGKYGGGVYCEEGGVVNSCKIIANSVTNAFSYGGGLMCYRGGEAFNCAVISNNANLNGGGVYLYYYSSINNCTISGNSAGGEGGGVFCNVAGTSTNCIIYYNSAPSGHNWYNLTKTNYVYCCTTPEPGGVGNITNAPMFVNIGAANYHLLEGSPCIDAGTNLPWMIGATDLDGNPRIYDGTVDMGAYEFIPEPGKFIYFILFFLFGKNKIKSLSSRRKIHFCI